MEGIIMTTPILLAAGSMVPGWALIMIAVAIVVVIVIVLKGRGL